LQRYGHEPTGTELATETGLLLVEVISLLGLASGERRAAEGW
jgi:hypothetical protein